MKKKTVWRKKADVKDVEENLEELRNEERAGGKLYEKSNQELFQIDTKGDDRVRQSIKKQTLKIDQLLTPQSAVPGIMSRSHPISSHVKEILFKEKKRIVSKQTLKQIEKRKRGLMQQPERNVTMQAIKNPWNEPKETILHEFIQDAIPKPVKKKRGKTQRVGLTNEAVKIVHPGASYNPRPEDHEENMLLAAEKEVKKIEEYEKIQKKLSYPKELDLLEDETFFNDESEEEINEQDVGEDKIAIIQERKTKAQRRKEARRMAAELQRIKKEEQKAFNMQLHNVTRIKKQLDETLEKITSKPEKQIKRLRLGPRLYDPLPDVVALPEDLPDSMRKIKPESNLFKDRFNSLQERGIIETRVPTKRRAKYKRKVVEVHSYKRFK